MKLQQKNYAFWVIRDRNRNMSKEKAEALISRWENNNAIKLNSDGTYTRIQKH